MNSSSVAQPLAGVRCLAVAAVLALAAVPLRAEEGTFQTRSLTPETALRAARAALEACRKQGFQVSVAIVDRSGIPQVLLRDRFAGPHTVEIATKKAWTAASFRRSTAELAEQTQPGKSTSGLRGARRVMPVAGGEPIEGGGTYFGGIGVSGGPGGEADESCAKAGLAAIADVVSF